VGADSWPGRTLDFIRPYAKPFLFGSSICNFPVGLFVMPEVQVQISLNKGNSMGVYGNNVNCSP